MITTIEQEQGRIAELLDRLERDVGDIAARPALLDSVVPELAERVARADRLTYRGVRSLLRDGSEITQRHQAERIRTRDLIDELGGLEPTQPAFEPLVSSVVGRLRRHIADDRSAVLPRLVDAVTPLSRVGGPG
jgi:hypothetical protein